MSGGSVNAAAARVLEQLCGFPSYVAKIVIDFATPSSLHLALPLLRSMTSTIAPRHFTILSPTVTPFGVDCALPAALLREFGVVHPSARPEAGDPLGLSTLVYDAPDGKNRLFFSLLSSPGQCNHSTCLADVLYPLLRALQWSSSSAHRCRPRAAWPTV